MTRPARLLILLNHTLTEAQVDDARQHLGIATYHYPPAAVQALAPHDYVNDNP